MVYTKAKCYNQSCNDFNTCFCNKPILMSRVIAEYIIGFVCSYTLNLVRSNLNTSGLISE